MGRYSQWPNVLTMTGVLVKKDLHRESGSPSIDPALMPLAENYFSLTYELHTGTTKGRDAVHTKPSLVFDLTDEPTACGYTPSLECYLIEGEGPKDGIVIMPGGGYQGTADHEKQPVAEVFTRAGMHAFVLTYSVAPCRYPQQLFEAARAIRLLRQRSRELGLNSNRIAVLGFSAGGHLAGSLATMYDDPAIVEEQGSTEISARPDAVVLCYPVISSGEFAHTGSFTNLLGEQQWSPLRQKVSLETRVSSSTPPTFLWHTFEDIAVPIENSLLFVQALRRKSVPCELHCFPNGKHGIGLAQQTPGVCVWTDLCLAWLHNIGFSVLTSESR